MNHHHWRRGLVLAGALALSACGTDSDDDAGGTDAGADTITADAAPDGSGDAFDAGPGEGAQIVIPGMSGPATAYIDAFGVFHADCQTDPDCAAMLGYFHARDRFAQMDLRRRLTTGRIGTLVTDPVHDIALDIDRENRAQFTTTTGKPIEEVMVESASPETLALLEAYSAGVNAWLADAAAGRNGAQFSEEFGFALIAADEIPAWEPSDCIATVVALVDSLTNNAAEEIRRGLAYASTTPEVARDLFQPRSGTTSTILSDFAGPSSDKGLQPVAAWDLDVLRNAVPALELALARVEGRQILDAADVEGARGSNNWIVSPELSASGNALLTNDPHLGLSNPSIWYLAHLDARTNGTGSIHAAGMSFAGLPWIVIGQNEDLAWGATNSFFDQSDVYVETLSEDGNGVLFNGEVVPFIRQTFTYALAGADPVEQESLYVPHHGTVLSIDEEAGTAITHRWTGTELSTDVNFLTELMKASNITEAQEAIANVTSIGQNWVVATRDGDIGWFPYNNVPVRPWLSQDTPSWIPLPGDGSAEWAGYYDLEDLPQALNPAQGYLATANNDMTGEFLDGDPTNESWSMYQTSVALGIRHERIVQLLEARDDHDTDSMLATVGDVYSLLGERLAPDLIAAASGRELSPAGAALVAALEAWDFECPTGLDGVTPDAPAVTDAAVLASSIGCTAFHAAYASARNATYSDERNAEGWASFPTMAAFYLALERPEVLGAPDAWWDDVSTEAVESKEDTLVAGIEAGAATLVEALGDDASAWLWGRVHTVTLRADLFDSLGVDIYNHGPFANDGGDYTVDVANTRGASSGNFSHSSGASMRMVCEAGDPMVRCQVQLPGGQAHRRPTEDAPNPNYDDLLQRWLVNAPIDLEIDLATVAQNAPTSFTAGPE
jgi:penicillin amidase